MRRYKRPFFLALIFLSIIVYASPQLWQSAQDWRQRYKTEEMPTQPGSVSSSLVYLIKPEQWLSYTIAEGTQQLRIISNGHIEKPDNTTLVNNWKYILRYQLLDKTGKLILDKTYHQRSHLSAYKNKNGAVFYGNYYTGQSFTPLDSRLILLSIAAIKQAKTIRISFIQQSPEVKEIAVRLYIPAKVADTGLARLWLRMSEKKKQMLAKHSVYPHTLLSATEKRNLLKNQWQPVGPDGIEGEDYFSRTLYMLRETGAEKIIESKIAMGLHIDKNHPGIIAIPEQGGILTIDLKTVDGIQLNTLADLQLNWYGRTREQRWSNHVKWLPDQGKLSFPVQGGLLQIKASEQLLAHAFLNIAEKQTIDITPKPLLIKAYLADHQVDYPVLHVNNQPTPMRVDIRSIYQKNSSNSEATLTYQWFDHQLKMIKSAQLSINNLPSLYDRLSGKHKDLQVTEPVSYYFKLPANISLFRLVSDQPGLIVNAYNQPWQFEKKQRVPENSYVSLDKKNWSPAWFMLQPANERKLIKQLAVRKIAAQYHPPEDNPDIVADQYLWQDYRPQEKTETQYILTEIKKQAIRDEALASVYCQLTRNQIHRINLKTFANLPSLTPELIYLRNQDKSFNVSVQVDNNLALSKSAIGRQGSFRLPEQTLGKHHIKVTTKGGGQWLMNHISDCSSQTFLKRRVFKLNNQPLTFLYNNEQVEEKTLSARFYADKNNTDRSVVQVAIKPLNKLPTKKIQQHWTFTHRAFDIRAPQGKPSAVLHNHGHFLNNGESFFIPFKQDLPKGLYRIKISLKQGAPGYLALTQLQHGLHEQRRFYWETNEQHN